MKLNALANTSQALKETLFRTKHGNREAIRKEIFEALLSAKLPIERFIEKTYEIYELILEGDVPMREFTPQELEFSSKHDKYIELETMVLHNAVFNKWFNYINRSWDASSYSPSFETMANSSLKRRAA